MRSIALVVFVKSKTTAERSLGVGWGTGLVASSPEVQRVVLSMPAEAMSSSCVYHPVGYAASLVRG